jgi:hypothetical protein
MLKGIGVAYIAQSEGGGNEPLTLSNGAKPPLSLTMVLNA